jgi:hypothetical protein
LYFIIPGRQDKLELKGGESGKTSSASIFADEDAEICAHARNITSQPEFTRQRLARGRMFEGRIASSEIAQHCRLAH